LGKTKIIRIRFKCINFHFVLKIKGRALFTNNIIGFKSKFNLILLCNTVHAFDKDEPSVWRRARCIEFTTKFVENPKNPNEKAIDITLDSKINKWAMDFMLLLLESYKTYEAGGCF